MALVKPALAGVAGTSARAVGARDGAAWEVVCRWSQRGDGRCRVGAREGVGAPRPIVGIVLVGAGDGARPGLGAQPTPSGTAPASGGRRTCQPGIGLKPDL